MSPQHNYSMFLFFILTLLVLHQFPHSLNSLSPLSVIRVDIEPEPLIPASILDTFFNLAKAGFSQKRKTLRNSLSAGLRLSTEGAGELLEKSGIDPMRRAETLSISEWAALASQYRLSIH